MERKDCFGMRRSSLSIERMLRERSCERRVWTKGSGLLVFLLSCAWDLESRSQGLYELVWPL